MFSAGIPASYYCDKSNNSFFMPENDTTMTGSSPKDYSIGNYGMEI
jgi:hypothetical protein